jgi:hypothetical protein
MDWQIRPMQTMGESDEPWDSWLLFRTGEIAQPVAVIQGYELKKLVEQYQEHEARKKKKRKSPNDKLCHAAESERGAQKGQSK